MISVRTAITVMAENSVDFVIIGGVALSLYSSAYITYDIDFCFDRRPENLKRIALALAPYAPRLRGSPADLPFIWDERTLAGGTNFTLETTIGEIDLLAEVSGLGNFQEVLAESNSLVLFGFEVQVLSIEGLIKAKTAAGREKDVPGLKILHALREAEASEDE
jgi:predicted nucleotidyltransferase